MPSSRKEIINEDTEVLEEGLKFFKVSTRLYKLANKIDIKAKRKDKKELFGLVKKVNHLADKFEHAEDLYEIGRKTEAKVEYKKLISKYNEVLKMMKKSEITSALKAVGGTAVTIASMTVPYLLLNKFFPSLSFGAVQTAALDKPMLQQSALFLKRAGAMTLFGIPVRAARNILDNGTSAYDDKIVKQVDNLLS